MEYTTRLGSGPRRAHVNYQCPCSCIGGVIYNAEKPLSKPGRCCCGRILWVGSEAEQNLRGVLEPGVEYEFDLGTVTLPWGDVADTAMAWPATAPAGHGTEVEPPAPAAQLVRDPVCGMMINPDTAAATSAHRGQTFYFCASVCKTRFDADPRQYVKSASLIDRIRRR
jgi:YHS domain-containing protein